MVYIAQIIITLTLVVLYFKDWFLSKKAQAPTRAPSYLASVVLALSVAIVAGSVQTCYDATQASYGSGTIHGLPETPNQQAEMVGYCASGAYGPMGLIQLLLAIGSLFFDYAASKPGSKSSGAENVFLMRFMGLLFVVGSQFLPGSLQSGSTKNK